MEYVDGEWLRDRCRLLGRSHWPIRSDALDAAHRKGMSTAI
jgi:hypothetical protein